MNDKGCRELWNPSNFFDLLCIFSIVNWPHRLSGIISAKRGIKHQQPSSLKSNSQRLGQSSLCNDPDDNSLMETSNIENKVMMTTQGRKCLLLNFHLCGSSKRYSSSLQ